MPQISTIQLSDIKNAHRYDAEYFKPEYLEIEKNLNKKENSKLETLLHKNIICGPFGSAILTSDYKKKGLPLLRVLNLHNFFLDTTDLKYISYEKSNNLSRYFVKQGDIVVSQRGSVAEFSLIEDEGNYIISANLISIKNNNSLNFYYLITFLNSKYGKKQLEKKITGQVQEKITTIDIKTLKIPLLPESFQLEIEKIVKEAYEKQKLSKKLYKEAEQILLEELGLVDYKPKHRLVFESSAKEIAEAHRFDSEFFQPKYKEIIEKIENYENLSLADSESFEIVTGSYASEYTEKGKAYIRSVNINEDLTIDTDDMYYTNDSLSIKDIVKTGDIVTSRVGSIGTLGIIKEELNNSYISDNILRIRNFNKKINNLFLAFYLKRIGIIFMERLQRGSVQQRLNQETLKEIKIPLIKPKIQERIAEKVNLSHKLRRESKELLEEAKRRVEEEIER